MKEEQSPAEIKEVRTGTSLIRLGDDRIVRVLFVKDSTITPDALKEDHRVYTSLTKRKSHVFLFDAEENVTYTSEARDFAHKLSAGRMTAVAVVVRSLGYRLIAEFYYKINKPPVPYKVFSSAEEAEHWLKLYS